MFFSLFGRKRRRRSTSRDRTEIGFQTRVAKLRLSRKGTYVIPRSLLFPGFITRIVTYRRGTVDRGNHKSNVASACIRGATESEYANTYKIIARCPTDLDTCVDITQ